MNFENHENIVDSIVLTLGEDSILANNQDGIQPYLEIAADQLLKICKFLKTNENLYFDFLNCITAVDNGPEINTVEVWYHMSSLVMEHALVLKVTLERKKEGEKIPSLAHIWRTADWHEREAFDLLGVYFEGHPDLRRILLPADWEGFPLRKDYIEQEKYHGINVKYDR